MSFPDPRKVDRRYRNYGFAVVGVMMILILCYATVMIGIILTNDLPIEYSETKDWATLPDLSICTEEPGYVNANPSPLFNVHFNSFRMDVFPKDQTSWRFEVPVRMRRLTGDLWSPTGIRARGPECATALLSSLNIKMDSWSSMMFSAGYRAKDMFFHNEVYAGDAVYQETPSTIGTLGFVQAWKGRTATPLVLSLQQITQKHKSLTPWATDPQHKFTGVSKGVLTSSFIGPSTLQGATPQYVIDNITGPHRPYRVNEWNRLEGWPSANGIWDTVYSVYFYNDKATVTTITTVGRDYQIVRMLGGLGGFITIVGFAFAVCFEKKYPHSKQVKMNEAMTLRGKATEGDYEEDDGDCEDSEEEEP